MLSQNFGAVVYGLVYIFEITPYLFYYQKSVRRLSELPEVNKVKMGNKYILVSEK